jgi:nitrate reductase gamma subunit
MISGFAAPFRYLMRPGYQLVRSRRRKPLPARTAVAAQRPRPARQPAAGAAVPGPAE